MKLYREILVQSKSIDREFEAISGPVLNSKKIVFPVPRFHPRFDEISAYSVSWFRLENLLASRFYCKAKNRCFIVGESVSELPFVRAFIEQNNLEVIVLPSVEGKIKTTPFLDGLAEKNPVLKRKNLVIVVVGGGLLLNVGAYLAERASAALVLFPTTLLSMADGAGGKVRVNFVSGNRAYKHFYKSFFEPDAVFLDDRFLESLPKKQIQIGLVEVVKHGLFQSPALYRFLSNSGRRLFSSLSVKKKRFCGPLL